MSFFEKVTMYLIKKFFAYHFLKYHKVINMEIICLFLFDKIYDFIQSKILFKFFLFNKNLFMNLFASSFFNIFMFYLIKNSFLVFVFNKRNHY